MYRGFSYRLKVNLVNILTFCVQNNYRIDEEKRRRFSSAFSAPSVRKLHIRDNTFVLINSMALEGDGCSMCTAAENKLKQISKSLNCAQVSRHKHFYGVLFFWDQK